MKLNPIHKFLGHIFFVFVILLTPASTSYDALILEDQWPQGKQRPHVVFDIDDTLCTKIPDGMKIRLNLHKISPETILIPFYMEKEGLFTHAFFPGMGELFWSILSWGWNIDFFSSGLKERNESVIPNFLKEALAPYLKEPEKVVEHLMANRIRIYSKNHMVKNEYIKRKGYNLLLISSKDSIHPPEAEFLSDMPAILETVSEDGNSFYQMRFPAIVEPEEKGDFHSTELEDVSIVLGFKGSPIMGRIVRTIPDPIEALLSVAAPAEITTHLADLFRNRSPIERCVFLESTHKIAEVINAHRGVTENRPRNCHGGNDKKDLRILGIPLEHTILIEDDPTYAVEGEQFPPICVSSRSADNFSNLLQSKRIEESEILFDGKANASFLLGILSQSRQLMEKGLSLRSAVQKLRRLPAQFVKGDACPFSLRGPHHYRNWVEEKDIYERQQAEEFTKIGLELIEELKSKRTAKIQSEKSEDPYFDLIREIYGTTDLKEGDIGCILM